MLEYQNIKISLKKIIFQIGLKRFLRLKELKALFFGHMPLVVLKTNKLLEHFTTDDYK